MKDFSDLKCSKCGNKPKKPHIMDGKVFCDACFKKIQDLRKAGMPK